MAIKENLLSVISSIQSGDFLRVVTSDGASRKASLSNVGKWLVENYEGSTLAESAQSIKAAVDGIYNKAFKLNELYASATINNPDNAALYTWYLAYTSGTNIPDQGMLYTYGSNSIKFQVLHAQNATYLRRYVSGAWSAWSKLPTRAEMDTVNGKIIGLGNIPANGSVTLSVANNTRAIIVVLGGDTNAHHVTTMSATSGGTLLRKAITSASAISDSINTNTYTLNSTSSATLSVHALVFAGSITVS